MCLKRIVIIGAGIVGASIARVLSRYNNLEIILVEKNVDVGRGVSKANTGLIHAGYDDDPDKYPLRSSLVVKGNKLWQKWVKELYIPNSWPGDIVVAFDNKDMNTLKELLKRGRRNGVVGLRIIDCDELRGLEPMINPEAIGALWAPSGGQIASPHAVVAITENAVANGVRLLLETEVLGIEIKNGNIVGVRTNNGFINADIVINAAGLYADKISKMAGIEDVKIRPRKGEYIIFHKEVKEKVRRIIFPTPTEKTKGVVVTTEVNGHLMIGPNAQDLPEGAKEDVSNTKEGLEFVWNWARRLLKSVPPRSAVMRTFAGLRPEPDGGDFIIRSYEDVYGFINVAGIRSPGLTAAPAIAYFVRDIIANDLGVTLTEKRKWSPTRRPPIFLSRLPWEDVKKLVAKDAKYGKIVCRCGMTSEAEIIDAIKRMKEIGVKKPNLESIKMRTTAMKGRCQGSFCTIRIVMILAREYNVPVWKILQNEPGSEVAVGHIKTLLGGEVNDL